MDQRTDYPSSLKTTFQKYAHSLKQALISKTVQPYAKLFVLFAQLLRSFLWLKSLAQGLKDGHKAQNSLCSTPSFANFVFQEPTIEGNCDFDRNAYANHLNSSASKSADACQKKCKLDQNCLFYKFDEKSKQCSTFSTAAKTCSAVIGSADLILKACPKNKTKSMFVYPPLPSYFSSFLLIIFLCQPS